MIFNDDFYYITRNYIENLDFPSIEPFLGFITEFSSLLSCFPSTASLLFPFLTCFSACLILKSVLFLLVILFILLF